MTTPSIEVVEENGVQVVEVIYPGPQGPPGLSGTEAVSFVHQQQSPSTTWVINHNLGFRPSVELLDTGSQEIDGEIAHPSVNQTVVTLNPATAGIARLI